MLVIMRDVVRLLRRIAITAVGTVIVVAGAILLVAPGPGLLVIALGLAVLAAEYDWARRRLNAVRARALSAASATAASRAGTASTVLFGLSAVAIGVVLICADVLPVASKGRARRAGEADGGCGDCRDDGGGRGDDDRSGQGGEEAP